MKPAASASPRPPALVRLLHRLPAETAHELTLGALSLTPAVPGLTLLLARRFGAETARVDLGQDLLGARFPNPVGLAAGFDKNARAVAALSALGFGSIEIGTVTPRPQRGNPKPRLFRHPESGSLENALGFNNAGGEALARRLERHRRQRKVPLGVNLGRNRTTPNQDALDDYSRLIATLDGLCDYFVINVSSPNTPGLRDLQTAAVVEKILERCRHATDLPILIKLSPDLPDERLVALAESAVGAGARGVILTNTTIDYARLKTARRQGGLSGEVLTERSRAALEAVAPALFGRATLVSVGGIASAAEVYRRIRAGASLVQIYTALVYSGPGLIRRILEDLAALLARDGFDRLGEAVGADLDGKGVR